MSRASLGAADCGKRLSIADEGVVQTARQTGERNWICLEKDERRMDAQTDRVCYIILYSLVLLKKYYIINSNIRKMQIIPSSRRHILCNPRPNLKQISRTSRRGINIPFYGMHVTSRSQLS